jgi:membrane protein YqaA with SNARE-associated domain
MDSWLSPLLHALALPEYGLATVFVVCLISATLLPVGSEFAVIGLVKLNPDLFWPTVIVATLGNTLGGATSWWTGYGAEALYERIQRKSGQLRALEWLRAFGPPACLLSWLPVVGDPLCALAGWLRLPFWPCVGYMAIGKFLRYVLMTAAMIWAFPGRYAP